jgi:hypothetical protein
MIYGGRYKKMATVRHIIEVFGEGFYPDMSDGRQECKNSRVLSRQSQAVLLVRGAKGLV